MLPKKAYRSDRAKTGKNNFFSLSQEDTRYYFRKIKTATRHCKFETSSANPSVIDDGI